MRILDALQTSYKSLKKSKMRTFLTVLGVSIGIASVIILMSVGQSAKDLIVNQVQGMGSNLIFLIPGASKNSSATSAHASQSAIIKTLTDEDVAALRRDPAIESVSPQSSGMGRVVYENNDVSAMFQGVSPEYFSMQNFKLAAGRFFDQVDNASMSNVAVIGPALAKTLFNQKDPINKNIRLKNTSLRVIGVFVKKGMGVMGVDLDNTILLPIQTVQKKILSLTYYNLITVQGNESYNSDFVKARVNSILRQSHHITDPDKDDFTVMTQEDALAIIGNVTSVMTIFLIAIASISLLVGGIGIMNIMLVSITERTKEIGLRKAVGATEKDIIQQFLYEAIFLTLIGGILGLSGGFLFSFLAYIVLVKTVMDTWVFSMPISAVVMALLVSVSVGLAFGLYPARKAARKNPIDALRNE